MMKFIANDDGLMENVSSAGRFTGKGNQNSRE